MHKNYYIYCCLLLIWGIVGCQQTQTDSTQSTTSSKRVAPLIMGEAFPDLFKAVQLGEVFPDSKTFTDCTPKRSAEEIASAYASAKGKDGFKLEDFVKEYFEVPPQLSSDFKADTSKSAVDHINSLWPVLTRQPDDTTQLSTKIPLPKAYIAPGGRFREIYYWDSYFTMLGLQVSANSKELVRSMVENFAYIIDEIGFIPNGNRTYFRGRSQPPFFSLMVGLLSEMEGDKVLEEFLPAMEKEYTFWMKGQDQLTTDNNAFARVVRLPNGTILNRYYDNLVEPRAESYKEDVHLAKESGRDANELYTDLRAACESGWDFSSRWFEDPNDLGSIHTTEILPVDLNSLMYNLEVTLARAYGESGNENKQEEMADLASSRRQAIQSIFWDEKSTLFQDYDFVKGDFTGVYSVAAMFPLFLDIATNEQGTKGGNTFASNFIQKGGVTSTLNKNGQQWDAPNGWAPLQWVAIKGFRNYGLQDHAQTVKERFVKNAIRVYKNTGKMVEKYNVYDISSEAGGGEYPLQDGFGWTNGVLLRLLTED
ncbi:MAG: alpha,alpha-trehalase TreF [Bacteroidota bacterium]